MTSVASDDYTVAWVCALPIEAAAARAMLDKIHTRPRWSTGPNAYEFGEINGHYVVIVLLPAGVYGTVAAAHVLSDMLSTFSRLRFALMVGIGGGVPSEQNDIRLGDVVVSKPGVKHSGVIQYAYGKAVQGGQFEQTGTLNKPPQILLTHINQLQAKHMGGKDVLQIVQQVLEKDPDTERSFSPRYDTDYLFQASYHHASKNNDCGECDHQQLVNRDARDTRAPQVHYGLIASADNVMKDSETRDRLAREHGILCFEMEAAGLMDKFPTLVIRGICDYCDSHKQKEWQGYAALTAAAYTKLLLSVVPVEEGTARSGQADIQLQQYYDTGNRLKIKRLSGELLDMEQCYINLSIIESRQESRDTMSQAEPSSSDFSLLDCLKLTADTPEQEVTLPDLFCDRKLPDGKLIQPRRILIRGRAGVGKTTLCKKIVHDFYHQEMWTTLFDRIVWIPLRRLKGKSTLDEFFRQEYFSFQPECDELASRLSRTVFDPTHKRTLWLLDGLDEISGDRSLSGTDLTETFDRLLSRDNVIVTSRPYAVNIAGLPSFDLELETVGFHPSQVETYLAKTTKDPAIANQISSFIRSHWLIQELVRIPIQLDALCYTWSENSFLSDASPQTMTEIYQAIELKLWKKDILNLQTRDSSRQFSEAGLQKLRTRMQIQSEVGSVMEFLERLAFAGLYNNIIEFHQDHRDWLYEQQEFCKRSDDDLDRLSFLRTSDTSSQDKSYHFLHLTFQEFFAAQYFVRCSISDEPLLCLKLSRSRGRQTIKISPEEFLKREKYSGRYDVFWRFVTGLLHDIDENQVCSFLKKIEAEPRDLLGPAHQRLLMHCFSEIPQPEDLELAEDSNGYIRYLRDKMEHGCIKWSEREMKLYNDVRLPSETEFPDHVLCELLDKFLQRSKSDKENILYALSERWHMSPKLMTITARFLNDDDGSMRVIAVQVLGSQPPWQPEIFQAVLARLEDSDWRVKQAALQTLRGRSSSSSSWPPEVLCLILDQLYNGDWHIKKTALQTLSSQSPWLPHILQAVIARLEDSNYGVREAAVDALCSQSTWPPEIFQAVVARLEDSDSGVRQTAVQVLGSQPPWQPEIFQAVLTRLDDSDSAVRQSSPD
ncbi:hypothetical protein BDV18DRAFT_161696 [Aspergillus unguis]